MDQDIQFDIFLDSEECESIFEGFQSALKTAFALGYTKGKNEQQQLS